MSFTAVQNNPITVNLVDQSNYTGWTVDGSIATHSSCQQGFITLLGYPIITGHTYTATYTILAISGGTVYTLIGNSDSSTHSSPGIYTDTITAVNNDPIKLHSNANCTVQLFNVKDTTINDGVTIVYAAKNRKWSDNRTMYPTFGFSLYERSVVEYLGDLYVQQNGSSDRNNFFGEQFESSIQFIEAKEPTLVKTFQSIAIQANQLMVTEEDGIVTSLGQISELSTADFIKSQLNDGVSSVQVSAQEGIYSANLLSDKRYDLFGPDALKGNWIQITLTTNGGNEVLNLFTVAVNTSRSFIGVR